MTEPVDPTGGWAEATAKASAAATEVTKAAREVGGFISPVFRAVIGMAADKLEVTRFERQVRLSERVTEFLRERGLSGPTREVVPSFLVPLVEHACLEQDDELQDIWARMLTNAADANSKFEMRTAYVRILADMTAFDVKVLAKVAESKMAYPANRLPDGKRPRDPRATDAENKRLDDYWQSSPRPSAPQFVRDAARVALGLPPRHDVQVSVDNLVRLGCLHEGEHWCVSVTALGRALINACTG